jgi:hypothetical protein
VVATPCPRPLGSAGFSLVRRCSLLLHGEGVEDLAASHRSRPHAGAGGVAVPGWRARVGRRPQRRKCFGGSGLALKSEGLGNGRLLGFEFGQI